jgi:hypothetical protein
MKKNMGTTDRVVRTFVAILLLILLFSGEITGTVGVILAIVAIVFLITSLVSFCPLYVPMKISTRKELPK